jgi:3-hydroxyisobutyrate dehydrogenase-like beta-hydroxyacid dehydrogenase
MNVAFIGLGNMGAAIADRILTGGFSLTVWNRTAGKADKLAGRGARVAATPSEAAAESEIVITSLMDDQSVLDVTVAPDGLLKGMRPGTTHACLMTISPACADRLQKLHADVGTAYISAPVAGRPNAAAVGQLASFLGGDADSIGMFEPVCRTYSTLVTRVSERPSLANIMKLAVNYNVACTIELISETYIFAEKCGLSLEHVRDFYQQLWFAHPAAKLYSEKLLHCDFEGRGGFVMTGGLKDVKLMLSAAAEAGASLKVGEIVEQMLSEGVAAGMGEQDWSSIHEIARRKAGLD